MNRHLVRFATLALMAVSAAASAQFSAGNLVISRAGNGTETLANTGNTVWLDQYTTAGSLVNSTGLPTTASGSNKGFYTSGTATSELQLNRSGDGRFLTLAGYSASGSSSIVASTSATNPRVFALIGANGSVDTSTALTDAFSAGNPRAAYTLDGSSFYGVGSATGQVYATLGATTSTVISTTVTNTRQIQAFGGDLYYSTGSGTRGIYKISGTPTASGQTGTNVVATGGTSSPYDFFFLNSSTMYVADDTASTSGGIFKYTLSGGTWGLSGTYNLAGVSTGNVGARSMTTDGSKIYAVTTDNRLVSIGLDGTNQTTLATAGTNQAFRGVRFAPQAVPEPTTMVALGLGALGLLRRRRKNG